MIIECIAIFFSFVLPTTSSILTGMFHILSDKEQRREVMSEINYLVEGDKDEHYPDSKDGSEPPIALNLPDPMTNENLTAGAVNETLGNIPLEYIDLLYMEAMRMDPPFPVSEMIELSEDIVVKL